MSKLDPAQLSAMNQACEAAERLKGATSPNPPVGAAAMDRSGRVLSLFAHERAGAPHAEARVLADCTARGLLSKIDTLVTTLEPCNHHGRTPPCSHAIAKSGIRRVLIGSADPNPRVEGGGAAHLRDRGIEVEWIADSATKNRCDALIAPFVHWASTGLPYVTVKTAHLPDGSMIPPPGQKTFTSPDALKLAHELRRQADAILTGSGTILSDNPLFTVRHVPDPRTFPRWLVILDRRGRVPIEYEDAARGRGFETHRASDLSEAFSFLGKQGCLEVLVEAGPTLSQAILDAGLWNRHVRIESKKPLYEFSSDLGVTYFYRNR